MRLRHRAPLLAIVAVGAILPAAAAAADPPGSTPAPTVAEQSLATIKAGLSLDVLGIKITIGSPPPPPPSVAGDPALLALSLAAEVGVNAGPLSAQIDANAGATVSQNAGAAVTVDANVNVPGVVDTGVAVNANVPPVGSGGPVSGSLRIKGLDRSTTPASGSTSAVPATPRPSGGAIAGGLAATPPSPQAPPVTRVPTGPRATPGTGPRKPVTTPRHPARGAGATRTPAAVSRRTPTIGADLRAPSAVAPIQAADLPVSREVIDAVVATGRTLALPLALLAALLAYLGLQRLLDRGPKLAWANGRTPPDDELLEL